MNSNGEDIAVDSPAHKSPHSTQKNGIFVKNQWMCNCTPRLPAALNKVRKMGKNEGRGFWTCSKNSGPRSGCGFYLWIEEAREREKRALLVAGQLPSKTATPSRRLRQTKISESFQRGKPSEWSSFKKPSLSESAKGKSSVVRFEEEVNGEPEADCISIPSDIENAAGDNVPIDLDTDSGGDTQFEDALDAIRSPTFVRPPLPQEPSDDPSEGPRKIARTKNNTSPSKHLLDQSVNMSVSHMPYPSTESTVADTPPIMLQQQHVDTRSMATSAQERCARQSEFDNVDPVAFPNLQPLLEADKGKKPVPAPWTNSTVRPSASSTKLPTADPANPMGPGSTSPKGVNGHHPMAPPNSASTSGKTPLEEKTVPNGLLVPSTPQKSVGTSGTPGSSLIDRPVDITSEVFGVLGRAEVSLHLDDSQDLREILKKSYGKQVGYYTSRDRARKDLAELRRRFHQQSHDENEVSVVQAPATPSQSFAPASQSFGPPSSQSFVPESPLLDPPTPSSNTKEAAMLRGRNTSFRKTIETLRKELVNAKKLSETHLESVSEYHHENEKLHKTIASLQREIRGLKEQIKKGHQTDCECDGGKK
ncbi:hypothetical protein TWF481_007421 [Arthrobotrys musiformis]|uniref:GRF-type domain-containing protein n=1 Tax=Arthrobotrys musiformis TaxID=47236 RepID=A0AAV9WDB2_9PEZI